MAETINISEIAEKISDEIFRFFRWQIHPNRNTNFNCVNPKHTSPSGQPKRTHPGDVVFHYEDPYLAKRIYLHTDLKSYADTSITPKQVKSAFESLCLSTECANQSDSWREKYSVDTSYPHEVRGLLFVHNYTRGYDKLFHDLVANIKLQNLPIAKGNILHFLGPQDVNRLWSICNDMMRLIARKEIPEDYTYYYPDLMTYRRHGDVWNQAATIEVLTGPYIIIKHGEAGATRPGYIIYFNRPAASPSALEYFLDSLSRYQMLESGERIRLRCTGSGDIDGLLSRFDIAKQRYAKAWGFDPTRVQILQKIEMSSVTSVTDNFNPGTTGWRE